MNSEALQTAAITTTGFGPITLGKSFSQIARSTGVELFADACDYRINPGGYLNVILETRRRESGDPVLTGIFLFVHPGGVRSVAPTTPEGVALGTTDAEMIRSYPDASLIAESSDGDYWLLRRAGGNELIAWVVDGVVKGLGVGDADELIAPNCE